MRKRPSSQRIISSFGLRGHKGYLNKRTEGNTEHVSPGRVIDMSLNLISVGIKVLNSHVHILTPTPTCYFIFPLFIMCRLLTQGREVVMAESFSVTLNSAKDLGWESCNLADRRGGVDGDRNI